MIKRVLKAGEKGQVMILALILLAVGGLTIAPVLSFMGTGLIATQDNEERMMTLYAADAGAEDALWKIRNDQVSDGSSYALSVNNRDVVVEVVLEEDLEQFLEGLLNQNYSGVHDEWTVIEESVGVGTYTVSVTYNPGPQNKAISGIGAWLEGDYYEYAGTVSGITDDYPVFNFRTEAYRGGTAFIWEWTGSDRPWFGSQSGVYTRTLTFEFTPPEIPSFQFGWVDVGSADIGVIPSAVTFEIWGIAATATDSATGRQSRVVAYMSRHGEEAPYSSSIIIWETNPPA